METIRLLDRIDAGGRVAESAFVKALDDREDAVRIAAIKALEERWSRHTTLQGPILKALTHDDPRIRQLAWGTLYYRYLRARSPFSPLDARAEVPALVNLLGHERAEIRDIAAIYLGAIGPRKARSSIPALVAALRRSG